MTTVPVVKLRRLLPLGINCPDGRIAKIIARTGTRLGGKIRLNPLRAVPSGFEEEQLFREKLSTSLGNFREDTTRNELFNLIKNLDRDLLAIKTTEDKLLDEWDDGKVSEEEVDRRAKYFSNLRKDFEHQRRVLQELADGEEKEKIFQNSYERMNAASTVEKQAAAIKTRRDILRRSLFLSKEQGGRKPTIYQFLAHTALKCGLDSVQLREDFLLLNRIYRNPTRFGFDSKESLPWVGNPMSCRHLFMQVTYNGQRRRLVDAVEQYLFESVDQHGVGEALSSQKILEKYGLFHEDDPAKTRSNYIALAAVTNFLDSMKLVRKMPPSAEVRRGEASVWMHPSHKMPMITYRNIFLHVFGRIAREGGREVRVTQLHKPWLNSRTRKQIGNTEELFSHHSVGDVLKLLKTLGLVEERFVKTGQQGNVRSVVWATPEGLGEWRRYQQKGGLTERLRVFSVQRAA